MSTQLAAAQRARGGSVAWAIYRDRLPSAAGAPRGWRVVQEGADGIAYRLAAGGHMTAIESIAVEEDGHHWHHVSIARRDRLPTWEELGAAKEAFIGDRYAYVVFPPQEKYVNIHTKCLHLWSCLDTADGKVLPEFSGAGSV